MPDNNQVNSEAQFKEAQLKLQHAYKKTFSGEEAEKVLRDLEVKFAIHTSTYFPGMDGFELANREGSRFVVLYIKDWLRGDIGDKQNKLDEINKVAEEEHKL